MALSAQKQYKEFEKVSGVRLAIKNRELLWKASAENKECVCGMKLVA